MESIKHHFITILGWKMRIKRFVILFKKIPHESIEFSFLRRTLPYYLSVKQVMIGETHKRDELSRKRTPPANPGQDSTEKLIAEIKKLNVNEFTSKNMEKANSKLSLLRLLFFIYESPVLRSSK